MAEYAHPKVCIQLQGIHSYVPAEVLAFNRLSLSQLDLEVRLLPRCKGDAQLNLEQISKPFDVPMQPLTGVYKIQLDGYNRI